MISLVCFVSGGLFVSVQSDSNGFYCAVKNERVIEYFCRDAVIRRMIWYVLHPQAPHPPMPPEDRPETGEAQKCCFFCLYLVFLTKSTFAVSEEQRKYDELTRMKIYCSELFTNTESVRVLDTLVGDFTLMDCLFSYWHVKSPPQHILVSFVRLVDFMMRKRFAAFVRYVKITNNYVLVAMANQVCLALHHHCHHRQSFTLGFISYMWQKYVV
jgi:hypothetical protein